MGTKFLKLTKILVVILHKQETFNFERALIRSFVHSLVRSFVWMNWSHSKWVGRHSLPCTFTSHKVMSESYLTHKYAPTRTRVPLNTFPFFYFFFLFSEHYYWEASFVIAISVLLLENGQFWRSTFEGKKSESDGMGFSRGNWANKLKILDQMQQY